MHLKTRNVNSAFRELVTLFNTGVIGNAPVQLRKATSRYGNVTMIDEPVTVSYQCPTERVLTNPGRDCNPFFHLYEALWMLAGRNDVAPLAYYNSKMPEFSDDGVTFNGAYGYRWRKANVVEVTEQWEYGGEEVGSYSVRSVDEQRLDQLDLIVAHLKAKPDSRRAVLQMWNVEDDLLKIDTSKDTCCNLSVMFSLRQTGSTMAFKEERGNPLVPISGTVKFTDEHALDMAVTNRSNDLIWGLLGANAVQFSILQEYMAARLGASVGWYHQITNNLHAYEATWEPAKWLAQYHNRTMFSPTMFDYDTATTVPLVRDPEAFEQELHTVVNHFSGPPSNPNPAVDELTEPFLRHVAGPMFRAFQLHKCGEHETANRMVDLIRADDWRRAAHDWLQTRATRRKLRGVDK